MEDKIKRLVRHTPVDSVQSFLMPYDIELPEDFEWSGKGHKYAGTLASTILRKRDNELLDIIERVHDMHTEIGQAALLAMVKDRDGLLQQKSEYDRSLWAFLHHEEDFREAEQFMYLDSRRNSRESGTILDYVIGAYQYRTTR